MVSKKTRRAPPCALALAVGLAFATPIAEAAGLGRLSIQSALGQPLRAEVVKLHCFIGMSHAEIADVLNVSEKTVKRYWAYAKAWLHRALTA